MKSASELGLPISLLGDMICRGLAEEHVHIPRALLRYVFGPMVVHIPSPAEQESLGGLRPTLHEWRPRVNLERLEILTGERPHDLVSPTEIMLVMINATLQAPLHTDLTQLYQWASRRAWQGRGILPPGEDWAGCPEDADVFDGRLTREYQSLCRQIFSHVGRHSLIARPRRRADASTDSPDDSAVVDDG